MEEIPYMIVPFKIERKTWEKVLDHVSWNKYVPDALKPDWKKALQFLYKELGKDFFKNSRKDHPVDYLLGMGSEKEIRYLLQWVELYKYLKANCSSFPILKSKITANDTCRKEGVPFMDIAFRFHRDCFAIEFLKEIEGQKNADILVTYKKTNEQLYIEVSRINESDQHSKEFKQYVKLVDAIDKTGYYLPSSGKLKCYMSESQCEQTLKDIVKVKTQCWETQSMEVFENENIIIAFSTDSSFDQLEAWSAERNFTRGLLGLNVEPNETIRIIRQQRIVKEAKQIPKNASGLICLPVPSKFLLFTNPGDIIADIGPELLDHPQILGLALYTDTGNTFKTETFIEEEIFIYAISSIPGPYVREVVYIQNPNYNGTLSNEAIVAIRNSIVGKQALIQ